MVAFSTLAQRVCVALFLMIVINACYSLRWAGTPSSDQEPAPAAVAEVFAAHGGALKLAAATPGDSYAYDPGEIASGRSRLPLRHVEMRLHERAPKDRVLVDLVWTDDLGNRVTAPAVDLLRIVPKIDGDGEQQLIELMLEEFTRYAITFRREHGEFGLETANADVAHAARDAYRLVFANNCLDPTKWELVLTSADFADFGERLAGPVNLNQDRILAHSWFFLDPKLYTALLRVKNPHLTVDPALAFDYGGLSEKAEQVKLDFDLLRAIGREAKAEVVSVAQKTGEPLKPLDAEQHYKWSGGLFLNKNEFPTYADVVRAPVRLAEFKDEGFYRPDSPKIFDLSYLEHLDRIRLHRIENSRGGSFVEITLSGEYSPYEIKVGNVDLALVDEQALSMFGFGINMYPLVRRHSPRQATIQWDQDLIPQDIRPYLFMIDKASGRFVNNEFKGLDRLYLGWNSIERDTLEIYLISYERITPVWKATVRIDDELVDRARMRRALFG
jgi:hypothetical protein